MRSYSASVRAAASLASSSSRVDLFIESTVWRLDGRSGGTALDLDAGRLHEPAREHAGRRAGDARLPERARAQGAVAVLVDGPQREPSAPGTRRAQGGRAPGLVLLGRDADDGALFRRARAERPGRRQAPCEPRVPCDPVPLRQSDARQAGGFSRLRRGAELPVADQGQRRRGHLDRLGRARRRHDALRLDGPGLCALPQARSRDAPPRTHDRGRGRCRARRGQCLRGAAGGLEARCPQSLVDHRL